MEDKLLDENDTKVLINLSISMNEHVCLSVCMFAIGRNTVGGRKKQKRPSNVKFSGDEDRLIFNSLPLGVFEKT